MAQKGEVMRKLTLAQMNALAAVVRDVPEDTWSVHLRIAMEKLQDNIGAAHRYQMEKNIRRRGVFDQVQRDVQNMTDDEVRAALGKVSEGR